MPTQTFFDLADFILLILPVAVLAIAALTLGFPRTFA